MKLSRFIALCCALVVVTGLGCDMPGSGDSQIGDPLIVEDVQPGPFTAVSLPAHVMQALQEQWAIGVAPAPVPLCRGELRVGFTSSQRLHNGAYVVTAKVADVRSDAGGYIEDATFVVDYWNCAFKVMMMYEGYTPSVELAVHDCAAA
jgi:hypothetical protein